MKNQFRQQLEKLLPSHSGVPLLIHSDLFRSRFFVKKELNRKKLLTNHSRVLQSLSDALWIPTFNYQFPHSKIFNTLHSKSELGPLNEFMRTQWAQERSLDPIFSIASLAPIHIEKKIKYHLVAFSHQTAFSELVKKQGGILFYGAEFSAATIIHHIEYLAGRPLYRYDKVFNGVIINAQNEKKSISYEYHVRPLNKRIEYDWAKLKQDLIHFGLWSCINYGKVDIAIYLSASDLASFWLEKLKDDPLYFLDKPSRAWVEPKIDQLGRRFKISDFEDCNND